MRELPKTVSGKIRRNELRRWLAEQSAGPATIGSAVLKSAEVV